MAKLAACLLLFSNLASADVRRPAMAEPLLGESITDIDSDEPGETEVDLTAGVSHALDGLTWGSGSVELELRLTRRLGVSLELGLAGALDHGTDGGLGGGLSVTVWHDARRDFHLQVEARAQVLDEAFIAARRAPIPEGDAPPFAFGLRGAFRHRWLTARFGLGPSIGGSGVPLWADAALFAEWGGRALVSFAGAEVVTDWASPTPIVVSPEIVIGVQTRAVPIRIGVGMPVFLGNREHGTFVGALARLMLELERD